MDSKIRNQKYERKQFKKQNRISQIVFRISYLVSRISYLVSRKSKRPFIVAAGALLRRFGAVVFQINCFL